MIKKISTNNALQADHILSQGLVVGDLIFVAGQVHCRPDGSLVTGSVEEKIEQIMASISAILQAGNATLQDVVKVVIYVTDMAQMPELNRVYPAYFGAVLPVREAVCVKELPLGASIEISVIAAKR